MEFCREIHLGVSRAAAPKSMKIMLRSKARRNSAMRGGSWLATGEWHYNFHYIAGLETRRGKERMLFCGFDWLGKGARFHERF